VAAPRAAQPARSEIGPYRFEQSAISRLHSALSFSARILRLSTLNVSPLCVSVPPWFNSTFRPFLLLGLRRQVAALKAVSRDRTPRNQAQRQTLALRSPNSCVLCNSCLFPVGPALAVAPSSKPARSEIGLHLKAGTTHIRAISLPPIAYSLSPFACPPSSPPRPLRPPVKKIFKQPARSTTHPRAPKHAN
jgi:hypothetical protein